MKTLLMIPALIFSPLTFAQTPAKPNDAKINLQWTINEGLKSALEVESAAASQKRYDSEYSLAQSKIFPTINAVASAGTRKPSSAYRRERNEFDSG